MKISENIIQILNEIPKNVKLVAVSKTKPNENILEAYNAGQRIFGENKVQDLVKKFEELPNDIQWHFIGHLQTNKVKFIACFVGLIHAVDSLNLLEKINSEAKKNNRIIDILFQIYIAEEESKFGLDYIELIEILNSEVYCNLKNVNVVGLMGMATYTDNIHQIRKEFASLKETFQKVKQTYFLDNDNFKEISMGMSGDYKIAIEEGSTMIRVGSNIFGERNY
jgi:pyridoxal phosphate enzyme (YggS family)